MATRIKARPQTKREEAAEIDAAVEAHQSELAELAADWLEEIDRVLEGNAETFVAAYIQKGGQ